MGETTFQAALCTVIINGPSIDIVKASLGVLSFISVGVKIKSGNNLTHIATNSYAANCAPGLGWENYESSFFEDMRLYNSP